MAPPRPLNLAALACAAYLAFAAAALAEGPPATVRVGDSVVLTLASDAPGKPAKQRAASATAALAGALEQTEPGEVRVQPSGDGVTLLVGNAAIVELTQADATLAGASSLDAFAADRASALGRALASERKRGRIAETVFSCSLVVFFALIAFYLIKRLATLADRARFWLDEHGDQSLAVSVKSIELVRPAVVKSSAVIALGLAKWVGQFGIFYAWLLVVLSLFESTRGYTERLTGFVITPLSLLVGRTLAALPVLVIAGFAALAVLVLVRFTGLFLGSVARRETYLGWLPADLAAPASVVLRVAIVIAALAYAAPVVTGSADDSLARTGTIVLWALGIAATPLLATSLFGAAILFDRRLGVGDHVRVRGECGRIVGINLLELRLMSATGSEWRVPHLLLSFSALERLGPSPRVSVELTTSRALAPARVLERLVAAGDACGKDAAAEILDVERDQVRYRLTASLASLAERGVLLRAALEALGDGSDPNSASSVPSSDGSGTSRGTLSGALTADASPTGMSPANTNATESVQRRD
ncbi:MAG TPA: mechanosensitive ion channel family protein [Polyangiaceae bacterium]|nr:mechanosensitive ion channel family protein [Polyangiaceae bacterium]